MKVDDRMFGGSGIYFPISALGFSILTLISFYVKKSINTKETKIYKYLMITNFLGLIIEILCTFAAYVANVLPGVSDFVLKSYLVYNFIWTFTLLWYVLYVSYSDKIEKIKNSYKVIIGFCMLVVILLIYSLDCNLVILNDFTVRYTEGPSVNFTYLVCGIMIGVIAILSIKDKKNLSNKKFIPIFSFLIAIVVGIILQKSYPGLLIMTYVETLTIAIMYQTIENPDIKMLNEMHKSKEISDNANDEKSLFIYNMTQESRKVNNNINDIVSLILSSNNLDEMKDYARDILNETAKYANITYDILGVNDGNTGNFKLYQEKYILKNLIKEIVMMCSKECLKKGIEFRTNIDHNIPDKLYGDSINLKKILTGLINNSINNTTEGYVEFSVNTLIKDNVCRVFFTIDDSSMGYEGEELTRLLNSKSDLSNINHLIIKMGGAMSASSSVGVGNKFKIILDQKIEVSESKNFKEYDKIYNDKKILVVDDSEASIKIIDRLLKGSKIEIDDCNTGKECIEKIKSKIKYDVILIDEELSSVTGFELLEKLRDIRNFNTPVILLTKDNSYEYNENLKGSFTDYLLKPIKKEDLLSKINNVIEKE